MVRKIRRQSKEDSKEGVEVSPARLIKSFASGIASLLRFAGKLNKEGRDEYQEQGEIKGRTKSGQEYKGAYGFRMKVGLNPEEFRGQKKLWH